MAAVTQHTGQQMLPAEPKPGDEAQLSACPSQGLGARHGAPAATAHSVSPRRGGPPRA